MPAHTYVFGITCHKTGVTDATDTVTVVVNAPIVDLCPLDPGIQTTLPCLTVSSEGSLTILPSSCIILSGASTCTVTGATWNTTNTTDPYLEDGNLSSRIPSTNLVKNVIPIEVWVAFPQTVFNLKDGIKKLDTVTVESSCTSGTNWDAVSNSCKDIPVGQLFDGVWSMWSPTRSDICGDIGTQTRTCVYPNPSNKGAYCPSDADGLALTKDYINTDCPVITPPVVTVVIPPKPVDPSIPVDPSNPPSSSGSTKVIVDGGKIPYNGKITMTWEQQNIASCTCTYKDSTGKTVDCPNFNGTPYSPPALKKATLFTLSCLGKVWGSVTVTKEVLVNDINTNYKEN
jgi:hypothetical protein